MFFAMFSSWFMGFSLIFSAGPRGGAPRLRRRLPRTAAASMLGLSQHLGQDSSGSAALQMAMPGALQPQIREIVAAGGIVPGGIIPFRDTIFLAGKAGVGGDRNAHRHAGDVVGHALR